MKYRKIATASTKYSVVANLSLFTTNFLNSTQEINQINGSCVTMLYLKIFSVVFWMLLNISMGFSILK